MALFRRLEPHLFLLSLVEARHTHGVDCAAPAFPNRVLKDDDRTRTDDLGRVSGATKPSAPESQLRGCRS
jgi:hypothetical protein